MADRVKVGYVPVNDRSSVVFPPPRLLRSTRSAPLGRRAVQSCPAVNILERRIIEVLAPFNLQIRCIKNDKGGFDFHCIDSGTRIDHDLIPQFVTFMPQQFWRSEGVPVVQIGLPHIFVCDTPCYITQMPAWASDKCADIPGRLISGRFPTHIWPRSLNLSFEWDRLDQDFRMKSGDPVCSLFVETGDPESDVSLVSAKRTDELQSYLTKIEDVVKFSSGSFNLFERALEVRPKTLLTEY